VEEGRRMTRRRDDRESCKMIENMGVSFKLTDWWDGAGGKACAEGRECG
jgi:hypothetical protein